MEVWTQQDELAHIRSLGRFSERAYILMTEPNISERMRQLIAWRIRCLEGYLAGSQEPRDPSKRFLGYDHSQLRKVASEQLAATRAEQFKLSGVES